MAIEPVSYADRVQLTSELRRVEANAVETAPDPAKLAAAAPSTLAGLSPFVAEARRSNALAAAAKAASVALVTQPVEVPPTEPAATTVEQIEPVEALPPPASDAAQAYQSIAEDEADAPSGAPAGRTLSRVA